jgi:hypothetical protein
MDTHEGSNFRGGTDSIGPGETIEVHPGARIPVDVDVVGGNRFVDQATITCESVPSKKFPARPSWGHGQSVRRHPRPFRWRNGQAGSHLRAIWRCSSFRSKWRRRTSCVIRTDTLSAGTSTASQRQGPCSLCPASPRSFPQPFRESHHPARQTRALIGFAPEASSLSPPNPDRLRPNMHEYFIVVRGSEWPRRFCRIDIGTPSPSITVSFPRRKVWNPHRSIPSFSSRGYLVYRIRKERR